MLYFLHQSSTDDQEMHFYRFCQTPFMPYNLKFSERIKNKNAKVGFYFQKFIAICPADLFYLWRMFKEHLVSVLKINFKRQS